MPNRPSKHNYVPAFYLAGFTKSGSDRFDRLHVCDQGQMESWNSTPNDAGCEHEFYSVNLGSNVAPSSFETLLAKLETNFCRVIRDSVKNEIMPDGDDFNVLLNFVALQTVRVPRMRRLVSLVTNLLEKTRIQTLVATDEGWQQFLEGFPGGSNSLSDADSNEMRQSILSGEIEFDLDRTSHVQKIVEMVEGILPLLAERQWSLGIAASELPDFVCSDAPTSVVLTAKISKPEELHLANPNTLLTIPLTRRVVLMGLYEERPSVVGINELGVLSINSRTIS